MCSFLVTFSVLYEKGVKVLPFRGVCGDELISVQECAYVEMYSTGNSCPGCHAETWGTCCVAPSLPLFLPLALSLYAKLEVLFSEAVALGVIIFESLYNSINTLLP